MERWNENYNSNGEGYFQKSSDANHFNITILKPCSLKEFVQKLRLLHNFEIRFFFPKKMLALLIKTTICTLHK